MSRKIDLWSRRLPRHAVSLVLVCAATAACASFPSAPATESIDMSSKKWITPEVFANVPSRSGVKHECTPALVDDGFLDEIVLSGPTQVSIMDGRKPVVPVCGRYFVPIMGSASTGFQVYVTHVETGRRFNAEYTERPLVIPGILYDPIPEDPSTFSEEGEPGSSFGGNLNVDLVEIMPGTDRPGAYQVQVKYGPVSSNVIVIQVVEGPLD